MSPFPGKPSKPIIRRVNAGIYDVSYRGERFELERYPDGAWLLFAAGRNAYTPREYMNDFATKRDAIQALKRAVKTVPTVL